MPVFAVLPQQVVETPQLQRVGEMKVVRHRVESGSLKKGFSSTTSVFAAAVQNGHLAVQLADHSLLLVAQGGDHWYSVSNGEIEIDVLGKKTFYSDYRRYFYWVADGHTAA